MKNLREMTAKELKEIAKGMKISNWWNLKKEVLIEKIEAAQNMTDEEKQAIEEERAREDAAIAEYTKDWKKYTKRYNVSEFLMKWKSGEIVLESEKTEEAVVEDEETEVQEETPVEEKETPVEEEKSEVKEEEYKQPTPKRGALIEWNGKSQNICAWGKELGISPNTLYGRLYKMNWSVEKAFTTKKK